MTDTTVTYWVRKLDALPWGRFAEHWNTTHANLAQQMPGLRSYSINIASEEQKGARPFDGYAMLRFDSRAAAIESWATPEGKATAADGQRFMQPPPGIIVDERIVVQSCSAGVKIVYLVTKLPDLPWGRFVEHWNTTHANLAQQMPGLRGYSINIASEEQKGARPFDGYAMLRFDSRAAAIESWATPEGKATAADGQRFMQPPPGIIVDERIVVGLPKQIEGLRA